MSPSRDTVRVLHVDDDPEFAAMAAAFLERADDRFAVDTATSVSAGLDSLAASDFDCVVSDYEMPEQDGLAFLDAVRAESPDLPFILFTGKGSEEIASEAISAGVTDYLQKGTGTDQYTVLANRIGNVVERWWAEQEAERTRARLEAITSNSSDVIVTVDSAGTIRFANAAAEDVFGYAPTALVGQSLTTLLPSSRHDRPVRPLETDERTADWKALERAGRHRDGHEIPLSVSFSEFERNDARRFIGVLRDVSEKRESSRQLQTLISNLPGIVYRCRNEPGWPMEYVRGECAELVGYSASELADGDVVWGVDVLHPDDEDVMWEAVQEALDTGEPFEVTYRAIARDGSVRWMWERGRAVTAADGERVLEGFITDITDREERKRELEQTSVLLSTLFETLPVGVLAEDAARNVLAVNDRMFELFDLLGTPAEVIGADCERMAEQVSEMFVDPAGFVERTNRLVSAQESQRDDEFELRDGRTFARSYEPIELSDGAGHLWVYHDATARKTREQSLRRTNERLEEFASVVSHDLRNPLNVAEGRLELARETDDSEHLASVARAHDRMRVLIEDLLTLAHDGAEVGELEPVTLSTVSERGWANVETGNATVRTATDGVIRADRSRLQQLLENLFRNAVDHGSTSNRPEAADGVEHGGSSVSVTVGALDDGFYVEDDGPGIPADDREAVFDVGYSTSREGTGFGLAIVEQVADAHRWDVRATEGHDGGARFEIRGVELAET
ncbi:PAS domain S-box protein [Salinigranum halophilum]|uniref:PAS domain S-box protein n=1 Tax=Salinigranum halophilum TaxID=2565931 RepID=UPI00115D6B08|nr:PAS domain S-box protein [Salinigranum halophilum]